MDDIGKIHVQGCSYVCRKILDDAAEEGREDILENICDHIPEDYGYCYDCDRISPDDSDYGYCPDCEDRYSDDKIEEIKEESKDTGFNNAIEQIESGEIRDDTLRNALLSWKNRKETKDEQQKQQLAQC